MSNDGRERTEHAIDGAVVAPSARPHIDLTPGRGAPPAESRLTPWRLLRALVLLLVFFLAAAHVALVILWFVVYPILELVGAPDAVAGVVAAVVGLLILFGGPVWMAIHDPTYFLGARKAPTRLRSRKAVSPPVAE